MRPNRLTALILAAVGLGIALVPAVSASPALATGSPHVVVLTVPEGFPRPEDVVRVKVKVLDQDNQPVDVDQPDELLEVRDKSGASLPFRPLMKQTGVGTYETDLSFPRPGIWTIVAGPDEADVVRLPPQVTIRVFGDVAGPLEPSSTVAVAALVLLGVLAVVLLGSRLRRAKGTRKALPEPEAHDTWWW